MKSRFGGAMLVAVGMVLGGALSSYDRITVATAAPESQQSTDDGSDTDALNQLRTIKTQVKEINAILHSGNLRVVVVINPENP